MRSSTRYGVKGVCKSTICGEPTRLKTYIKFRLGYALFTLLLFGKSPTSNAAFNFSTRLGMIYFVHSLRQINCLAYQHSKRFAEEKSTYIVLASLLLTFNGWLSIGLTVLKSNLLYF